MDIAEPQETESGQNIVKQLESDLEELDSVQCPICGTLVGKTHGECPACGISLERAVRKAKPMIPLELRESDKLALGGGVGRHAMSVKCPSCDAIIPENFDKCPICETVLKPRSSAPDYPGMVSDETPRGEGAVTVSEVGRVPAGPAKRRRLRSAMTTPPPISTSPSAVGRTNGVGQVNGLGMTNGTGQRSGKAFVNGTGISNGLGAQPAREQVRRRSFLTRWQFLAILIAVLIVIPTFVYISYSKNNEGYTIDGDFSDWSGATTYVTKIQSSTSASNITEWAVGTQASDLFVYVKTQQPIMSYPDPESLFLFVDSDGTNNTGYSIESIGADYMLQMTGWDNGLNSSSLSEFSSDSDHYDWTKWLAVSSLSCSLKSDRLEARASMPEPVGQNARFVLVYKDSASKGSVSCTVPISGGALVVVQAPADDVELTGVVQKISSAPLLKLTLMCDGEDGEITKLNPSIYGAQPAYHEDTIPLKKGEAKVIMVNVDASTVIDGQLLSGTVLASEIESTFGNVQVLGSGASGYAGSAPSDIVIDGAFADWAGKLSVDVDSDQVTDKNLDIKEVGNASSSLESFFYVSVEKGLCSGEFVPATVAKPSSSGGGGGPATRYTAEDVLTIYVDSDRSSSSGAIVELNTKQIGADHKIEVRGVFGKITSARTFDYSDGAWAVKNAPVAAAKDDQRIELGVTSSSFGSVGDVDFIVETSSWKGRCDLATYDPSSTRASIMAWVVDPASSSPYATSMSCQRKMFYDGVNFWSLYFDGSNTVSRYSTDDGQTWTSGGRVFATPGVNETSIWYDQAAMTVYAVGDISSATNNVTIQIGSVDAAAHAITWMASDSSFNVSTYPLGGKNAYISKDLNGFLWVLSSNCTQIGPTAYQLSVFKTRSAVDTSSWAFSGQMLAATSSVDNVKGSIVPAGLGGDMWAVYAYGGNVAARKYSVTWQAPQMVYAQVGSKANTDNSPPSVVVDGKGVVHVVYGTGRRAGQASIPTIEYSHNNTELTTFTAVTLDIPAAIGDYYPTITLDSSTGDLYAMWLQSVLGDLSYAPKNVVCKKWASGTWSDVTIQTQTTFTKQSLTSPYSVPRMSEVSWQWTQNSTAPIEVMYDSLAIPEFGGLALPVFGMMVVLAVFRLRPARRIPPSS